MEIKRAIVILEANKILSSSQTEFCECADIAIRALEKQIPKIPNYEGDGYSNGELVLDTWICPNCDNHYEVDYDDYDYCPKCGQHIDHSTLTEDD